MADGDGTGNARGHAHSHADGTRFLSGGSSGIGDMAALMSVGAGLSPVQRLGAAEGHLVEALAPLEKLLPSQLAATSPDGVVLLLLLWRSRLRGKLGMSVEALTDARLALSIAISSEPTTEAMRRRGAVTGTTPRDRASSRESDTAAAAPAASHKWA